MKKQAIGGESTFISGSTAMKKTYNVPRSADIL